MTEILTDPRQITPDWLTATLQVGGHLPAGNVNSINLVERPHEKPVFGNVYFLELNYSSDTPLSAPHHLFLKLSKPNLPPDQLIAGQAEVIFYADIAPLIPSYPLATCYSAVFDPETSYSHILTADLSLTHFQQPWPYPPSREHCEMLMDNLAQLHAGLWEHSQLGRGIGFPYNPAGLERGKQYLQNELYPKFADAMGDGLPNRRRGIYEKVLASDFDQEIVRRFQMHEGITLVHGDAHFGNYMLPLDTQKGCVCAIDWQNWRVWIGADELAGLIAFSWFPSRRGWLEKPLVKRYYQMLLQYGVTNYPWETCWDDYRRAVIMRLFTPLFMWRNALLDRVHVWDSLERIMLAFEDLGCEDLL